MGLFCVATVAAVAATVTAEAEVGASSNSQAACAGTCITSGAGCHVQDGSTTCARFFVFRGPTNDTCMYDSAYQESICAHLWQATGVVRRCTNPAKDCPVVMAGAQCALHPSGGGEWCTADTGGSCALTASQARACPPPQQPQGAAENDRRSAGAGTGAGSPAADTVAHAATLGRNVGSRFRVSNVPTPKQLHLQDLAASQFMHFSICTFADCEQDTPAKPASLFNPTAKVDTDQWVRVARSWGAKQICLDSAPLGRVRALADQHYRLRRKEQPLHERHSGHCPGLRGFMPSARR